LGADEGRRQMKNAEEWIEECLRSVLLQSIAKSLMEVSLYDDLSTVGAL
jgi:hypothetical protein